METISETHSEMKMYKSTTILRLFEMKLTSRKDRFCGMKVRITTKGRQTLIQEILALFWYVT